MWWGCRCRYPGALPGGDALGSPLRAGAGNRSLALTAELLELGDDHLTAVHVAVQQREQLGQH